MRTDACNVMTAGAHQPADPRPAPAPPRCRYLRGVPLASIPSPSDPFVFHLGGLAPRWYGILLAAGILLAILITRRQLALRGRDPGLAGEVAVWAVPCGVVGARLYHVATDWSAFSGHLENIPLIQQGGLGIYGALLGGALGAVVGARRAGIPLLVVLDCAVPGVALAQALGRFGNYFNQELFGGPTSLPWGLEIDPREPAAAVPRRRDVPPDVPLRVALEPARDGDPAARRAALAAPGGGLHARALPRAVFARALLRRGPARRSGPRDRAAPAQPGGRRRRLRDLARGARASAQAAAAAARSRPRAAA